MAQTAQPAQNPAEDYNKPKWVVPAAVGICLAGVIIAILHLKFGTSTPAMTGIVAVVNIVIFLITYSIFRKMQPQHDAKSWKAFVSSVLVSLPVFIIAFIGLGFEIAVMFDFAVMYMAGVWLGTAEITDKLYQEM